MSDTHATGEGTAKKPILLATDGSPTAQLATRHAIDLASALHARLVIVTVWEVAAQSTWFGAMCAMPDLSAYRRREAMTIVAEAEAQARDAGVAASSVVRRGVPCYEILAIAHENDVQSIVLGSHGWGALERLLFGDVASAVLHHATRPVVLVPRTAESEMRTVVEGYGDGFEQLPVRPYEAPAARNA
jgi:nucleotide-binding universal stress UspA family protein